MPTLILKQATPSPLYDGYAITWNGITPAYGGASNGSTTIEGSGSWISYGSPTVNFKEPTIFGPFTGVDAIVTSANLSITYNSSVSFLDPGLGHLIFSVFGGAASIDVNPNSSGTININLLSLIPALNKTVVLFDLQFGAGYNLPNVYSGSLVISDVTLTIIYQQVSVSSVSPNAGGLSGGKSVQVNGQGFQIVGHAVSEVDFGSDLATDVSVFSDSTLTCKTPAHAAGLVDVTVWLDIVAATKVNAFLYESFSWYVNPDNKYSYTDTPSPYDILLPTSTAGLPYYNPNTGDVLLSITNPGIPWIIWIPEIPFINILIGYITPNLIYPTFIQTQDINFNPINFNPINFNPEPPPDIIPFTPVPPPTNIIWVPIGTEILPEEIDPPTIINLPSQPTDNGYSFDVGGSAILQFIGSPSGIYTLIPGKTNDTLYDRTGVQSIDVKIPNPHVVTGFITGDD